MQKKERFSDLLDKYDTALKEYGLSARSRLEMLSRANVIIRKHENFGKDELDGGIIADYFKEIDERHFCGGISKAHWTVLRRGVERFLQFTQGGELKLANPTKGSRVILLPEYERIAGEFLEEAGFHPNTRNDARWAVYKYFAWLSAQGYNDLCGVGAEQIQKFLLDCSQNLSMGSVHDIKLYLTKLYLYLYVSGLSESSYQSLLSFSVSRGTRLQPILKKSEVAALLDSIDRSTKGGKRNYAIMLLGAVLISAFARKLEGMLAYCVARGLKEDAHLRNLLRLDKFCAEHYPGSDELTSELVYSWLDAETQENGKGLIAKASTIRQLGLYLSAIGEDAYVLTEKIRNEPPRVCSIYFN